MVWSTPLSTFDLWHFNATCPPGCQAGGADGRPRPEGREKKERMCMNGCQWISRPMHISTKVGPPAQRAKPSWEQQVLKSAEAVRTYWQQDFCWHKLLEVRCWMLTPRFFWWRQEHYLCSSSFPVCYCLYILGDPTCSIPKSYANNPTKKQSLNYVMPSIGKENKPKAKYLAPEREGEL